MSPEDHKVGESLNGWIKVFEYTSGPYELMSIFRSTGPTYPGPWGTVITEVDGEEVFVVDETPEGLRDLSERLGELSHAALKAREFIDLIRRNGSTT